MFKRFIPLPLFLLATFSTVAAQAAVLYANGFNPTAGPTQYQGIWDQAGVGIGGANDSVLNEPNRALGFGAGLSFGVGLDISLGLADDFTVPAGQTWAISNVLLYGYQANATSFPYQNATISLVAGSSPNGTSIYSATDLSASNGPGGIVARRVQPTTLTADNRKIWESLITPSTPLVLTAGDYWLRWGFNALNGSNSFVPPIVPTNGIGNAQQSITGMDGTYVLLADSVSYRNVELPFMLNGVAVPGPLPVAGAACAFQWSRKLRRRIRFTA
jgi:hypothetical protein